MTVRCNRHCPDEKLSPCSWAENGPNQCKSIVYFCHTVAKLDFKELEPPSNLPYYVCTLQMANLWCAAPLSTMTSVFLNPKSPLCTINKFCSHQNKSFSTINKICSLQSKSISTINKLLFHSKQILLTSKQITTSNKTFSDFEVSVH